MPGAAFVEAINPTRAPFCYENPLRVGWDLARRQGSHPGKSLVICI